MEKNNQFEHFKFIANTGQKPLRVDKFLLNFIEFATRNKIQKAIKSENVKVNNLIVKANYKVKSGDVVTIVYNYPKTEFELIPQNIQINIVYEDDDIVIVNKDPGMVVHPGFGNYDGTLVNALIYYFNNLPTLEKSDRPGLVHRIDKNTSGLLVVAKNELSLSYLSKLFFDRNIKRNYLALVWGDLENNEGRIEGHIGRHKKNRKVMDVYIDGSNGKHAVTNYKVLERFGYTTLVQCKLETGRTHQIRAHFKSIGHPLFNDQDYGGSSILKGTTFTKYKQFVSNAFKVCPRQALHADSLGFLHPRSGKEIFFKIDLPNDMQTLINKWRKYSQHINF